MWGRAVLLLGLACAVCAGQGIITTVAGTSWIFRDNRKPATQAALGRLMDVLVDRNGVVLAADADNHIVVAVSPATGILTVVAGNGVGGFSGEGSPGTRASLREPAGLWLDGPGNLYIADTGNHRIRKYDKSGILKTIVGTGVAGYSGDGGPATNARINLSTDGNPRRGIYVDAAGNLYFSDSGNNRVRKVDTNNVITTVAGTGVAGFSGDGGPATAARLNQPAGIFFDRNGNLYIADSLNYRVRRVSPSGTITTIAGNGQRAYCGDGGPALSACLSEVSGVIVDAGGLVLLADKNNHRIRLVDNSGTITTVAGIGTLGFSGDGGSARSAQLDFPAAIYLDPSGNLVIADVQNRRIRKVAGGLITTLAGNGNFKFSGDGGPATSATMNDPYGILLDPAGNLYIAEGGNARIRRMSPDGVLTTITGSGIVTTSGDGGPAVNASVRQPVSLARDSAGNLYLLDLNAYRVRKISPQGIISAFAGTGSRGFSGDGGPATSASLNFDEDAAYPYGVAADAAGNVYIADVVNQRVRKVNSAGIISTFAGNGTAGFSGDNGPATSATLNFPTGVAVDNAGNVYICDRQNHRVRRVNTSGTITTVAGNGIQSFSGDGGPATAAALNEPRTVAFDGAGGFYIADGRNRRVRQVNAAGIIRTVAGSGINGIAGDGGTPLDATFSFPNGLAVDSAGNLYISDTSNERIRKVLTTLPTFTVAPLSLRFSLTAGNPQPAAQRVSVSGSVTGLGWSGTVTTASGGSWLSVTPASGGVPGTLDVLASAANLAPGTYQGTVTVRAALSSSAAQAVAVTLEVTTSNPARLVVDPPSLSFTGGAGVSIPSQTIRIGNSGPGSITWTARASTSSGGNWLAVGNASGTASAAIPASVSVQTTAAASTLASGVYSGTVQIDSSAGGQSVRVTLLRSAGGQTILLSQSALQFTGVEGSSQAPLQTFGVLNTGQGGMDWTVEASTLSGGAWLTVSPTSGTSTAGALEVPEVEASAKVTGLRAGQYNGLIKLVAPGAANSPQFITVELNVLQPGSKPGVSVHPSGLIFAARAGSSSPGSKTVRVATASPGTFELRSGLLTFDGADWLESLPRNMLLSASDPRALTVQPNLGDLKPGVYRAALTLLLADGSPSQVVNVLFVVNAPAPGANPAGAVAAGECVAQNLYGIDGSLGNGFQARVGSPTSVEVELVDDCSNQVTNATVVAKFSNGDPPLALASLGDGIYSGTWRPGTAADQVTVTVSASLAPLATELAVNGQVGENGSPPALFAGGIVHAASFASGEALAPGSIVSAFGRNLAQTDAAAAIPLPKTLGTATVTIGGLEAPLYFSSAGQINLQVPFELTPNSRPQVVVKTRPAGAAADFFTVPETITIAAARPGIFTTNQGGTGQGVVLLNDRLADPSSPARAGDVVVVYCTGLGVTQPAVASGVASPGNPPGVTTAGVTATVGGVPAIVHFAGLTPGFVGLYQVNLQIPAGVTPDGAVPLVLIQDGVSSNTVTLSVR